MPTYKKNQTKEKSALHPRNRHRNRYDFKQLIEGYPPLKPFVRLNEYNDLSIDFFNPQAVKTLNKALLFYYYDIVYWDIPAHYLCPPIPGRADYIHYIADLLAENNKGIIPRGSEVKCLDIGVGANCIYPIIGVKEYGWSFIGAEIDTLAIESAKKIIALNPTLQNKIEIRRQPNPNDIFQGVIQKGEHIDVSLCNPPFHTSLAQTRLGTLRKLSNLTGKKIDQPIQNFGGQNNELWCAGGEKAFIRKMIQQSKSFSHCCNWFTCLISKQANLDSIYQELKKVKALQVKTIPMRQGNKTSRIVAWTYLTLNS